MNVCWHMFHETPIRLWNLTSKERMERVFFRMGIQGYVQDLEKISEDTSVLLIRGDYIFDSRVLQNLLQERNAILYISIGGQSIPVAAHVERSCCSEAVAVMEKGEPLPSSQLKVLGLQDLPVSFSEELRKSDPPYILPIREDNRIALEEKLFAGSYKGITDLVTKFLWPTPAKWATRFCALRGITPNQVTSLSLVFVIIAGYLFTQGMYWPGLVAGWAMTFLDTVDGKLARVTVTSSFWGNIFDHGIDLIHPPLWYWAWGIGLVTYSPILLRGTMGWTIALIFGGYVLGRVVEGTFMWGLGRFGIFCWKPFDSYFRLVTARRNPSLIFMTGSLLIGRPDLGLELVAVWTLLSTAILILRLGMALVERVRTGVIKSWLAGIDPSNPPDSLAVKWFTNIPSS